MARAEPADINVDELRRRARRRLVGAVVLALAIAVVVPMLLETEQKPLGEDVSVKIPPVDDGKFVNRLNDNAPKDAASGAPIAPATPAAKATSAASSPTPGGATDRPSKYDTHVTDLAAPAGEANPPAASAAPAAESAKAAAPAGNAPVNVAKAAPAAAAPAPREGFAVQLAAFADEKGANALAGRLKRTGYAAYTEPLKTSKGTLWRVRVGPYPSHEAAIAARGKLKSEGQSGIVAAIK
jgi:DedD protein